eukprot:jgi/Phyca11/533774/estExt2_fgenesh1_pg.C_PHYCAscaffold_170093
MADLPIQCVKNVVLEVTHDDGQIDRSTLPPDLVLRKEMGNARLVSGDAVLWVGKGVLSHKDSTLDSLPVRTVRVENGKRRFVFTIALDTTGKQFYANLKDQVDGNVSVEIRKKKRKIRKQLSQALAALPDFVRGVQDEENLLKIIRKQPQPSVKLLQLVINGSDTAINPEQLKNVMGKKNPIFATHFQQDAHEFLLNLVTEFEKSLCKWSMTSRRRFKKRQKPTAEQEPQEPPSPRCDPIIPPAVIDPTHSIDNTSRSGSESRYILKSIIHHLGKSIDEGHYVADVCNAEGQWIRRNDTHESMISEEYALQAYRSQESCYMFFYVKDVSSEGKENVPVNHSPSQDENDENTSQQRQGDAGNGLRAFL